MNVLQFFIEQNLTASRPPASFRSDASKETSYNLRRFIDILRTRQSILRLNLRSDGIGKHSLVGAGSNHNDPRSLAYLIRKELDYDLKNKDPKQSTLTYLENVVA